ncbi:universal stress protein [Kriegella aquimaris]|uniref:Nucleotide-binding universal stress protein, UspA family n=1 Tax=Kriegella aquimaris TaxID=192904 RepID=A0A1G9S1U5_9FLAO|nr:universal stress protein [Kriegella aquimaris]SDM29240.1 Nucleotide-binding universal stress protein, UspA family [Kriegella aquimaris]
MKKILVPIDFSEYAELALEVAATLAKKYNAEIAVLHMLGLSETEVTKNETQEFLEMEHYMILAKKRFDMFLNRPWLKEIKITRIVQNYKIFSEINNVAKEQDVDLIVMGSEGTDGLGEILVGSHTEKVVRSSEVPVLVIKKRTKTFKIEKIVFGFDFRIENIAAYQRAVKLFKAMELDVHMIYVNQPGINFTTTSQTKSKIDNFLRVAHHGDLPENLQIMQISDYSVEKGIYAYAKEIKADAIAIATHGRIGLAHFLKGSVGMDVANHSSLPVLTFKI